MKMLLSFLCSAVLASSAFALSNASNPPDSDPNSPMPPVLKRMISYQTRDGQHLLKLVKNTWDFAVQGGATTTALNLQTSLPKNAVIVRSWAYVVTTPTVSSGSAFSLQISCATTGDIYSSTSRASDTAGTFLDLNSTGAASAFEALSTTASCTPSIKWLSTANGASMSAGKYNFYWEYFVHE